MVSLELVVTAIISGVLTGGLYALLAMGTNLIVGIAHIINLAQGDFAMLGMFTVFWLFTLFNITPLLSLPVAFVLLFVVGYLLAKFVFARVFGLPGIYTVLLTYGLGLVIMNGAQVVWSGDYRRVDVAYPDYVYGPISVSGEYLIAFIFATVLSFVLYAVLVKTKLGKAIRAVSQDPEASAVVGINVGRIRAITTGIGIGLAGAGGAILAIVYYIYPYVGSLFAITAILICVLGGLGNVKGAYFGALILGLVQSLSVLFLPYGLKDAVGFAVFILVLLLRPKGLFGSGG